jgi:hypothetical protein
MLKPLFGLTATGIAVLLLWKLFSIILIPLAATVLGFLFLAIKFVLVTGAILLAVWLLRRCTRPASNTN